MNTLRNNLAGAVIFWTLLFLLGFAGNAYAQGKIRVQENLQVGRFVRKSSGEVVALGRKTGQWTIRATFPVSAEQWQQLTAESPFSLIVGKFYVVCDFAEDTQWRQGRTQARWLIVKRLLAALTERLLGECSLKWQDGRATVTIQCKPLPQEKFYKSPAMQPKSGRQSPLEFDGLDAIRAKKSERSKARITLDKWVFEYELEGQYSVEPLDGTEQEIDAATKYHEAKVTASGTGKLTATRNEAISLWNLKPDSGSVHPLPTVRTLPNPQNAKSTMQFSERMEAQWQPGSSVVQRISSQWVKRLEGDWKMSAFLPMPPEAIRAIDTHTTIYARVGDLNLFFLLTEDTNWKPGKNLVRFPLRISPQFGGSVWRVGEIVVEIKPNGIALLATGLYTHKNHVQAFGIEPYIVHRIAPPLALTCYDEEAGRIPFQLNGFLQCDSYSAAFLMKATTEIERTDRPIKLSAKPPVFDYDSRILLNSQATGVPLEWKREPYRREAEPLPKLSFTEDRFGRYSSSSAFSPSRPNAPVILPQGTIVIQDISTVGLRVEKSWAQENGVFAEALRAKGSWIIRATFPVSKEQQAALTAKTPLFLQVGQFSILKFLGDDPQWKPGMKRASWTLTIAIGRVDVERVLGKMTLEWDNDMAKLTVVCEQPQAVSLNAIDGTFSQRFRAPLALASSTTYRPQPPYEIRAKIQWGKTLANYLVVSNGKARPLEFTHIPYDVSHDYQTNAATAQGTGKLMECDYSEAREETKPDWRVVFSDRETIVRPVDTSKQKIRHKGTVNIEETLETSGQILQYPYETELSEWDTLAGKWKLTLWLPMPKEALRGLNTASWVGVRAGAYACLLRFHYDPDWKPGRKRLAMKIVPLSEGMKPDSLFNAGKATIRIEPGGLAVTIDLQCSEFVPSKIEHWSHEFYGESLVPPIGIDCRDQETGKITLRWNAYAECGKSAAAYLMQTTANIEREEILNEITIEGRRSQRFRTKVRVDAKSHGELIQWSPNWDAIRPRQEDDARDRTQFLESGR